VFTVDINVIAVITELEFPVNRKQHVVCKADWCVDRELRVDAFKYFNFNQGTII
jgi:hypothetical protein